MIYSKYIQLLTVILVVGCFFQVEENKEIISQSQSVNGQVCHIEKSANFYKHYICLKQNNYEQLSMKQLYSIANTYINTCNVSQLPVGFVVFMKNCVGFSEDHDYRRDDLIRREMILSFCYDETNDSTDTLKLLDITFWQNGDYHEYLSNYKKGVHINMSNIEKYTLEYFYQKYFDL